MNPIDCRSIHDHQDVDFHQPASVVGNIRGALNSFKTEQGHIVIHSFEIPPQLVMPLENLDDLLVALFRENESRLNDAHRKYLTICERLVAACYCHLYHFIELHSGETIAAGDDHVKKLAHEFHYNAPYELRTPVSALKAYYEPRILASMGVSSTPFLPENQDRLDQISSWVGELWKFVDDLPGCGSLMSGRMQPDQVPPCRYFGRHDPGRPC